MSETHKDLGYDTPPDPETNRKIREILDPQTKPDARHPDEDWRISEQDRKVGRAGVEQTRQVSAEHKVPEVKNPVGMSERRIILEAQHLQSIGAALTPQQQRVLTEYYRKQENQ